MEYSIFFKDVVMPNMIALGCIDETVSFYDSVERSCDFISLHFSKLHVAIELIKSRIVDCLPANMCMATSAGSITCIGGPPMYDACLKLCNAVDDWVELREDLAFCDKSRQWCVEAFEVVKKEFSILLDTLKEMAAEEAEREGGKWLRLD